MYRRSFQQSIQHIFRPNAIFNRFVWLASTEYYDCVKNWQKLL